jgi:hypothetical protein
MKLVSLSTIVVPSIVGSLTALVAIALPATAQSVNFTYPVTVAPVSNQSGPLEEFNRAFFSNDRNFYENRSLPRQVNFIFGSFVENEIYQDGRDVDNAYRAVFARQVAHPILRTVDQPSPFTSSVRLNPTIEASAPPPSRVFPPVIERTPPITQPLPSQTQPGPVPALW